MGSMRLGLLSDTHDNVERTRRALSILEDEGAEVLIHAGDVTSPRIVSEHLDGWRAWVALGNMDRDPRGLREAAAACDPTVAVDRVHELELGGARVGLVHGDDRARLEGMVNGGAFDLIVHGHTHDFRDDRVGDTRVVNPGAVHRSAEPSVCTYEAGEDVLERIPLEAATSP